MPRPRAFEHALPRLERYPDCPRAALAYFQVAGRLFSRPRRSPEPLTAAPVVFLALSMELKASRVSASSATPPGGLWAP